MLVYGKTFRAYYNLQHDILRRSTHSLSTTLILAIINSIFSIMSLLTSNKISAHFLLSVKRLETLSLGRTVCFFADQVAQLPNVTGSITVTSNYVLVTTALIAAKLYCGLGNYSQTATFPQRPSVTDFQVRYHGFASW